MKRTKVHANFMFVPVRKETTITTNIRHRGRNKQPITNQQNQMFMKKLNKSGALCATTRAFLCALILLVPVTASAGISGDATSGRFSSENNNVYLTDAEVTREGTLYTIHKEYTVSSTSYKVNIQFYTSAPIAVGEKIMLLTVDRSAAPNTIRAYDISENNGSWCSAGSTFYYVTGIYNRCGHLAVWHKANNQWVMSAQLMNSNNRQIGAVSFGTEDTFTVNFQTATEEQWSHGSVNRDTDSKLFGEMTSCSATADDGYVFGIWSYGGIDPNYGNITVTDNVTHTAYFIPNTAVKRTVTMYAEAADGTAKMYYAESKKNPDLVSSASVYEGVPIKAVATQTGSNAFSHWEDEEHNPLSVISSSTSGNITISYVVVPTGKNSTITAIFAPATPTYDVAATVSPVGAGTVTGADTYDEGDDVTLTATPANRHYRFLRWTESASEVATTASYTINSINAAHTLVAEFEEIPVTLDDNGTSDYYTATLSTFSTETDFQLMRTFYAGMWNTVCFPFDLTAAQRGSSDMSAATFYTLSSVTGDAAEGLDFNVTAITSETMTARTPYLVQVSGANITNPVFEGVTLAASAFTNNTSGTNVGDTKFFGTVHPTDLEIGENSGFLFLGQNNALYWPNVANKIRAFRAYFYSGSSVVQSVHPRVRIVLQNETTTDLSDKSEQSAPSVKKYMENGSLVIERDGKKYNAVGQEIK